MRLWKAVALLLVLSHSFVSFEAKAALARVAVAPASSGVHQDIDPGDPLSQLSWTGYHVRCHRPGRVPRVLQCRPSPDSSASLALPEPLPVPRRFLRRRVSTRAVARPGYVRRPDAERAPPA